MSRDIEAVVTKEELEKEGVSFYLDVNHTGVPVIGVKFQDREVTAAHDHSSGVCSLCQNSQLVFNVSSEEFPYRSLGFIVRIDEVAKYHCGSCMGTFAPDNIGKKFELTMQFVMDGLESICESRTSKYAPLAEIRKILNIQETTPS